MDFFRCIRRDGTEEHEEEEVKEKEEVVVEKEQEDSKDEPVHIDIMSDDEDDEEQKNDSPVPPKDKLFHDAKESIKNLRAEINAYDRIDKLQELSHESQEIIQRKRRRAPLDFFMKNDCHRSLSPSLTREIHIEANRTKLCGKMMGKSKITLLESQMKVTLWSLENEKRCWEDTIDYDHLVNLCLYRCPTGPPHLLILEMTRAASLATYYDSVCARLTQNYGSPPKCLYGAVFYFSDDLDFVKCQSAGAFSGTLQRFFDTEISEQEANLLLAGEIQGTVTSSIELKEEDSSIDRRRSLRLVEKESTRDDWSLARTLSRKYDKESAFLGDDSRPSSSGGTSNHSKRTRTSRISEEDKSKLLLTYPFEAKGPGRISITLGDIDRLPPGEFLNDSIIDFYYKFLWRHLERWQQKQVYFFSTHFFTALQGSKETATTTATAALALTSTTTAFDTTTPIESSSIQQQQEEQPHRFSRVFRWTQKVDLFEKKFLFVPINDSFHWSLAVICNPGSAIVLNKKLVDLSSEENQKEEPNEMIEQNPPCILFLDSLKCHRKRKFSNLLKEYLASEWKSRTRNVSNYTNHRFDTDKFTLIEPVIPLQTNSWDCGVFILMYASEIIRRMPMGLKNDQVASKLTCTLSKEMFNQEHVQEFRDYLLQLLYTLQSLQEKKLSEKQIQKEELENFQIEM